MNPAPLSINLRAQAEHLNRRLVTRLSDRGWPRLSVNQALTFTLIGKDPVTTAHLAARLGITRQSCHTLIDHLEGHDLITVVSAPSEKTKKVAMTRRGQRLRQDATLIMSGLEMRLEAALGTTGVGGVRDVLGADWEHITRID